jgi:hypothetical protein
VSNRGYCSSAAGHRSPRLSPIKPAADRDVLLAAAYLHDLGYAPSLVRTGLHPLDGSRHLRARGHERLAGLVAYHSGAGERRRCVGSLLRRAHRYQNDGHQFTTL